MDVPRLVPHAYWTRYYRLGLPKLRGRNPIYIIQQTRAEHLVVSVNFGREFIGQPDDKGDIQGAYSSTLAQAICCADN